MIEFIEQAISVIYDSMFGMGSRLNPIYIVFMVVIAFGFYLWRSPKKPFLNWAFPKEIYTHPSHKTDMKLFVFGRLLAIAGFINFSFINIFVIYYFVETFGRSTQEVTALTPLFIACVYLIVGDFCTYFVHRAHHEIKFIWPFHAVHHSAEVMTPLTVYRKHPIYDIISRSFRTLLTSIAQGLVIAFMFGQPTLAVIAGINIFYFVFNTIGSNFRHSHIWISYGPVIEHIFISPAQHQIHHSLERRHWHKNYGEVLAIWDWAFGTLYVPKGHEKLAFGLSTEDGQRIVQPHATLTDSLMRPIMEAADVLRLTGAPKEDKIMSKSKA